MKLKSVASSHTTDTRTAFKTDPPLTHEVLDCAIKDYFGEQWADTYFTQGGLFIVHRTKIPKEQISEYERTLTSAEDLVKKRKTNAEKKHGDSIKNASDSTGLPID
jgi:hypothetical protein